MPTTVINGIVTYYEVVGSGPPLLMFSPGGFDATLENWRSLSVYSQFKPLEYLAQHYTCIAFDQRESGRSGGRLERVTWAHYAAQGKGLLQELGVEQTHLMGGCMGCSPVAAFGAAYPDRVLSMILYWPAGGAKYRIKGQSRFAHHLAYAQEHGLRQVASLARSSEEPFTRDPRLGPWASVLRRDEAFADAYVRQDPYRYQLLVSGMARTLLDRDTVPGAEPEDLLQLDTPTLVVPGQDSSHAPSAARYLQECLPAAEYWDVPVAEQTEASVAPRLLRFLGEVSSRAA